LFNKSDLLTVGEMAKYTGVGVRALHYYERKNILKPVYVDPDSGYRYYSINQSNFISLLMNCVEFNIPLKELAGVIETDDITALENFFKRCIKTMERKSKMLELAIMGFNNVLGKIELGKQYNIRQIYQRTYEEKIYLTKPYGPTIKEKNLTAVLTEIGREIYGENVRHLTDIDNLDGLIPVPDVGYLCRYSPAGLSYYGFGEMTKGFVHKNAMTIPAGTYFFRQDESSKIENAREIFHEQLKGKDDFMVIETEEMFLSKAKVSQIMYELRLIV